MELTREENWWSNGPEGLCGTDSELFVWTDPAPPEGTPGSDERWVELWNHVVMRFGRHGDGRLRPLARPNVDTGMGLERLLMVLQGQQSVFECDVFEPWMSTLRDLWSPDERPLRLLSDHLRSSIVVIGDGVRPSNSGRGYVLRRLIRRALSTVWRDDATRTLSDLPAELMQGTLRHFGLGIGVGPIRAVLLDEERRFGELLVRGRTVLSRHRSGGPLTEEGFRYWHETHGLPRELVVEMLSDRAEPDERPGLAGEHS